MDFLQSRATLLGSQIGPGDFEIVLKAGEGIGQIRLQFINPRLVPCSIIGAILRVLHRKSILRRADENLQLIHLVRNGLDHLYTRRANPNDADCLAFEVAAFFWVKPRMDDLPLKAVLPFETVGQRRG